MPKQYIDPELADTLRQLHALRREHGAETPVGHRCSNLIEMIDNLPPEGIDYLTPDAVVEQKATLLASMRKQMASLAMLLKE